MASPDRTRVRSGASSWADKSLVREGRFYPRTSMKAADRLAFYASRLDLAEVSSTHWYPPTPEQSERWLAATSGSPGFCFDVQAWSLFSAAATHPGSLWPDLIDEIRADARERPRLYREHLSRDGLVECWARFRHALSPLAAAGRLGCVTIGFPHWVKPGRTSTAMLAEARAALDGWAVAVELPNRRWHEGEQAEETLALLEDLDLAFVCVDVTLRADGPAPVVAATADIAVVRFLGRRPGRWPWPYRYTDEELIEWLPRIEELGAGCREVHCLFSNTHADDAVANALTMREHTHPQATLF